MKNIALIVAGGSGLRIGGSKAKQYLSINGKNILRVAIEQFLKNPAVDAVKVVIAKGHENEYAEATKGLSLLPFCYGGKTRQESVLNGLMDLKELNPKTVLIHDAARPFVTQEIIYNVVNMLEIFKAVDVGITPKDTIKQNDAEISLLDRSKLYCTQTPQGFDFQTILSLHSKYKSEEATDDISLAIKDNIEVGIALGDYKNIKITTPEDLAMHTVTKVGMGYDVHKFDLENQGQHLVPICGVKIPHEYKVIAHSDGDVGLHALMDALLGTAALGDIGEHFPPPDMKWKDADSLELLRHVNKLINEKGGKIQNIDLIIICEKPKVLKYKMEMQKKLAQALEINEDLINIKATTTEKLGFTGRGEGIAAQAVCSVTY